jgi:Zn-dependent peptidase ImmA (M78 family)
MADAGISRQQLAQILDTPTRTIERWERDIEHPSMGQFHTLAKTLGRPESFFLLPRPPHSAPVSAAFRKFSPEEAAVTVDEAKALRLAGRVQSVTQWIRQRTPPHESAEIPRVKDGSSIEGAAETIRAWLDWDIKEQTRKGSTDASVTRSMRGHTQDRGVIALHLPLSENSVRGFSLPHEKAPLIAVSTKDINPARLFSYGHEIAHLFIRDESLCLIRENAGTERWCNQVAGALLMPLEDFRSHVRDKVGNELVSTVEETSSIRARYKVSNQACAIRLETLQLAKPGLFNLVTSVSGKKRSGGAYDPERTQTRPRVRLQQYGRGYVNMLLDASESGILPETQVLDLLKVSRSELDQLRMFAASGNEG